MSFDANTLNVPSLMNNNIDELEKSQSPIVMNKWQQIKENTYIIWIHLSVVLQPCSIFNRKYDNIILNSQCRRLIEEL